MSDEEFKKFIKEIKETINSPQGKETIKKVKEIMKRDNCSMIEACIKLVMNNDDGRIKWKKYN